MMKFLLQTWQKLEGCKNANYLRPGVSAPQKHGKASLYRQNESIWKSDTKSAFNATSNSTSFGAPAHPNNSIQSNKFCIPRPAEDSQGIGHIQTPMHSSDWGNYQKRPIDFVSPTDSVTHVSDSLQNISASIRSSNKAPSPRSDLHASSTAFRGKTAEGNPSLSTAVSSSKNEVQKNNHFVNLDDDDELLQVILQCKCCKI